MKSFNLLHLHSGVGDAGGIATYISNLLKIDSSPKLNIFVTCSKTKSKNVISSKLFDPSKIIFIDLDKYNVISLLMNLLKVRKISKNNSINLIHAHALRSGLLACFNRIFFSTNYIYTNHGLRFTQKKNFFKKIIFYIYEFIVVFFSKYTCCIRFTDYKKLTNFPLNLLFIHKLKLVKTKLSLPKYCFLRSHSTKKTIIGIGSLIEVKRPFLFLKIIKELYAINKDFDAIWIGDGELKNELLQISNKFSLPINWMGHVDHEQVKRYLSESSLTLLTSEFEVFPLSVIESYWSGLPVVSQNFFGIDEFIKDKKTGLIFPSNKNPIFIAEKINDFIKNQSNFSEISKYVTNYFWENLYDYGDSYKLYFDLYDKIQDKKS